MPRVITVGSYLYKQRSHNCLMIMLVFYMSHSTLFKAYWDDRSVIMKGPGQWSAIQSCVAFQQDSNPGPCDLNLGVLTTQPLVHFYRLIKVHKDKSSFLWSQKAVKIQLQDQILLTFTTLWANSADNKIDIFSYFFTENKIGHFMQIISNGDILHEMSNHVSSENKKNISKYQLPRFYPEC